MENVETFYGMSSTNEHWSSSTETSSNGSSVKTLPRKTENRDASCNVDFDEELNEIIDKEVSVVEKSSRKSVSSTRSTIESCIECKSSRYIRWDVLMSLGIGLWAVLCIVDVLHSKQSMAIEWLYESAREKKNVSRTVSIKTPTPYEWWFFNLWPYLWSIMSISNAGSAFVLLFLVGIVFCTDPKIRKNDDHAAMVENSLNSKMDLNGVRDPTDENEPLSVCTKLSGIVESTARKVVPVKLELKPAIYLHARILSNVEENVYELTELQTEREFNSGVQDGFSHTPKISDASNQTAYRKTFSVEKGVVARLNVAGYRTLNSTNISRLDHSSIATICPIHSSNGIRATQTFHMKIEEYMRKGNQYSTVLYGHWFANVRGRETAEEYTKLLNTEKDKKRMITSSPAFKKFLLRLKCNNASSFEIATTSQIFRNHLQDI